MSTKPELHSPQDVQDLEGAIRSLIDELIDEQAVRSNFILDMVSALREYGINESALSSIESFADGVRSCAVAIRGNLKDRIGESQAGKSNG